LLFVESEIAASTSAAYLRFLHYGVAAFSRGAQARQALLRDPDRL
jgi:hypothetical protein